MPNTGAKKVGGAFVEIFADDSRLVRGLRLASAKLKAWGQSVAGMGAKIFAAGAGALAPMLGAVKQFMSAGDALDKMSGRIGVSVEFLSALSHAAQLGGTNISALEVSIRRLQRTAYDAANGMGTAADAFAELGISIRQQNGQLKSTEQLFMESAVALSRLENNTKKAALATILFGRAGTQLLPMLRDGEGGLVAVMEEAKRLGLVMSTEDATAAASLTDAWTRLTSALKMSAIRIGAALAPALTELAERTTKVIRPLIDWIKSNSRLIVSIAKIAAVVAVAGAALITLGGIIFGLGVVFRSLATIIPVVGLALSALGTVLGAILSPIGLVATALLALRGYLLYVSGDGQKALSWLGRQFNALRDTALAAWQGISDALAAGDLALAAKILWLTLKIEWQKGINWLQEKWIAFKGTFVGISQKAAYGMAWAMINSWAAIKITWVDTTSFIRSTWDRTIGWLQKGWNRFGGFFRKVWARIKAMFSDTDAEAEIARINEEVAKKDEEINRARDEQIAAREQERQRKLSEIERRRAGAQEELDKMQAEDQARREKQYQDALKASEDKLAEARRQWEEARAEAARKRGEVGDVAGPSKGPGFVPDFEGTDLATAAQKFSVRGTFSALAAAGLGGGGPTERIAKYTEAMDKKLGILVREAQEGGLVFD